MKLSIIIGALLAATISTSALAITDFTCVSNCQSQGYQYGLCKSRCSTDDENRPARNNFDLNSAQPNKIKQTDFNCVNACTNGGTMWAVCKDRCSY